MVDVLVGSLSPTAAVMVESMPSGRPMSSSTAGRGIAVERAGHHMGTTGSNLTAAARDASTCTKSAAPLRRAEAGFSMVDVLIGSLILMVAVMVHSTTVLSVQRMNSARAERGIATETLARFVERMRADLDWAGLYARLRPLSAESAGDTSLSRLGADLKLTTRAVTSYYGDFTVPMSLGQVTILVQVPSIDVGGIAALRENVSAPRYGLPYDLNGDGTINGDSRNLDYLALPIVVHLRWQRPSARAQEVVLATWLRGER